MAITASEATVLRLNEGGELTNASRTGTFGVSAKGGDYKTLMMFNNTSGSAVKVTIAASDGFKGANDLEISVPAGKAYGLVVDSAYFKQVSGEYKDYYKVTVSAAVVVSVCELPQ